MDEWMKQKDSWEPSDDELALGVTGRCQEHGVQVKGCAHAVTEAPKERFEFRY
jgi:hypothetical protein